MGVVGTSVTDQDLRRFHVGGMRGVHFNLPSPGGEAIRRRILVDNPAVLYGFPKT